MDLGICGSPPFLGRVDVLIAVSCRVDKRFYKPQPIHRWVVAIFESQARFPPPAVNDMMKSLVDGCQEVGKN